MKFAWCASGGEFLQTRPKNRLQMRFRLAERVVDKIDGAGLASPWSIVRRNDLLTDRFHLLRLFRGKKDKLILAAIHLRRSVIIGQRKIRQCPKRHDCTCAGKQSRQKSSARVFVHSLTFHSTGTYHTLNANTMDATEQLQRTFERAAHRENELFRKPVNAPASGVPRRSLRRLQPSRVGLLLIGQLREPEGDLLPD